MNTKPEKLIQQAQNILIREAEGVRSLAGQINDTLPDILNILLSCQGHIMVTGTGTSRFVAERMAHLLNCCGTPAMFINAADSLHGGAGAITANEVVVIISKGGQSAEINHFAEIAKSRGAKLIAISEKNDSPLVCLCDAIYHIKAPGDADPFGMIATGSSLVNCAAADVLCVLLLESKGYTKEQFGETHPGGAVGQKLHSEK